MMKTLTALAWTTLFFTAEPAPAAIVRTTQAETTLADKADKVKILEGTFVRIDEGDYFHWVLKTTNGQERTFFILKPDASVDNVLEAPEGYVGKKCRITWKASQEQIPEAGGKIEIEQVLSVEWLGKK